MKPAAKPPRRRPPFTAFEQPGDFVIYFNTTLNVGSLLFVDPAPVPVPGSSETDTAHSIARFANIDSLDDLQAANFTAEDFIFA